MANICIDRATKADAKAMVGKLNPLHAKLILMLGDKTISECVERTFTESTAAWAGRVDGELTALWGVLPLEGNCGYPWLYAAPRIAKTPRAALVIAEKAVREMLAIYPRLYGFVDSRYAEAIRFAIHLGFTVGSYPSEPPFLTIERMLHERT